MEIYFWTSNKKKIVYLYLPLFFTTVHDKGNRVVNKFDLRFRRFLFDDQFQLYQQLKRKTVDF